MLRSIAILMLASLSICSPLAAQDYPNRPVRLITPYGSGGATDILARTLAHKLGEGWGQSVVVENRPGASGTMGSEFVARSAPDGYTLQLGTVTTHVLNQILRPTRYDGLKDFVPLATLASSPFLLAVHPSLKVGSVSDLIAYAKANPGKLSFSSSGVGTSNHLAGELFKAMAGIDIVHVPYKGGTESVLALIRNDVQMLFDPLPSTIIAQAAEGRVIALATTGMKRSAAVPELPTVAEAGLPGYDVTAWFGIFAPAHTPASVVNKIADAIVKASAAPDVLGRLKELGTEPLAIKTTEFQRMMQRDHERWSNLIRERNITSGN